MNDDALYVEVAKELQAKAMIPGVWARAFADADGLVDRARGLYIKYRVEQLAQARSQQQEEKRLAALAAASQRALSGFRKFAFGLLAAMFACVSFFCVVSLPLLITNDFMTFGEKIWGSILLVCVRIPSYLATRKCKMASERS